MSGVPGARSSISRRRTRRWWASRIPLSHCAPPWAAPGAMPIGRLRLVSEPARQAVADDYARKGTAVDAERIVLTASSSESYAFLFKLLADPGEAVLVPEPSYPLFDYLARLEGLMPLPYRLAFDGVWHIDFASVERAFGATHGRTARACTGHRQPEQPHRVLSEAKRASARLAECRRARPGPRLRRGLRPLWLRRRPAARGDLGAEPALADARPTFSLGGLSKACGLPQLKLGWIVVGGRDPDASMAALELVADTYLSVGTPVQVALPALDLGAGLRTAIAARVDGNRAALGSALRPAPP